MESRLYRFEKKAGPMLLEYVLILIFISDVAIEAGLFIGERTRVCNTKTATPPCAVAMSPD
jgi:hypothetical protein